MDPPAPAVIGADEELLTLIGHLPRNEVWGLVTTFFDASEENKQAAYRFFKNVELISTNINHLSITLVDKQHVSCNAFAPVALLEFIALHAKRICIGSSISGTTTYQFLDVCKRRNVFESISCFEFSDGFEAELAQLAAVVEAADPANDMVSFSAEVMYFRPITRLLNKACVQFSNMAVEFPLFLTTKRFGARSFEFEQIYDEMCKVRINLVQFNDLFKGVHAAPFEEVETLEFRLGCQFSHMFDVKKLIQDVAHFFPSLLTFSFTVSADFMYSGHVSLTRIKQMINSIRDGMKELNPPFSMRFHFKPRTQVHPREWNDTAVKKMMELMEIPEGYTIGMKNEEIQCSHVEELSGQKQFMFGFNVELRDIEY